MSMIKFSNGTVIEPKKVIYYDTHKVRYIEFKTPTAIGTKYGKLKFDDILLNEKGKLSKCTLSEETEIELPTGKLSIHSTLYFHKTGEIKHCYPTKPYKVEIDGETINLDFLSFYKTGKLSSGYLREPRSLDTPFGPFNFNIIYYTKNGNVKKYDLLEVSYSKNPTESSKIASMSFHRNGVIRRIWKSPFKPIVINNVEFRLVSFYENGDLKGGELAEDVIINDKWYKKYSIVGWSDTGAFLGSVE